MVRLTERLFEYQPNASMFETLEDPNSTTSPSKSQEQGVFWKEWNVCDECFVCLYTPFLGLFWILGRAIFGRPFVFSLTILPISSHHLLHYDIDGFIL